MQISSLCNSGKHIIFHNSAIDIRKFLRQPEKATEGLDGNEVERCKASDSVYAGSLVVHMVNGFYKIFKNKHFFSSIMATNKQTNKNPYLKEVHMLVFFFQKKPQTVNFLSFGSTNLNWFHSFGSTNLNK